MSDATDRAEHEEAQSSKRERNAFWRAEIERALRRDDKWWTRGEEVVDVYRGPQTDDGGCLNILWANTEVLKPAIYSHIPVPEVQRNFLENDPIGEAMALVMERTLTACMDYSQFDFDTAAEKVRDDVLLPGRGVMRVFYDAEFETVQEQNLITDEATGEILETQEIEYEQKVAERAFVRYIYWKDFIHSDAKCWDDVWWVAFATDMSREDLIKEFGEEKGRAIPLCGKVYGQQKYYDLDGNFQYDLTMSGSSSEGYARVWEIWDKRERTVLVVAEGYEGIIDEFDDPYELKGFFPTASPLFSISTNGSMEPVPEYTMYQYQAEELNILTRRITKLTNALKARGIGDADIKSLTRLFEGEDNEVILDEEFSKLMQAGGVSGAISWAPIKEIADVLAVLQPRRRECLNIIYELTGISDIMRGASDPRETATAVEKKGQYGSARIKDRQKKFQRYCRDTIRLLGEVVGNLFDVDTFVMMSGVENREDIMQGMQEVYRKIHDGAMRDYTIDIETDSTIAVNEYERRDEAITFFTAVGGFMKEIMPVIEGGMIPPEVAKELLLFAARRFDAGRELITSLESVGQAPPQQGGEEDAQAQAEGQLAQAQMKIAEMQMQVEMAKLEFQKQKAQMDFQIDQAKLQLEAAKLQSEMQMDSAENQVKIATEMIRQETVKINASGKGRENVA